MNKDIYGVFADNPSARSIINHAYEKARNEHFGGPMTARFEDLTGIDSDRTAYDAGNEPQLINQE